jgi:hypothetical protein
MRAFAKILRPVTTIEGLYDHLQIALELEHSTIPAYLYALYSIKDGTNQQSVRQIRSVVMEEMLHMTLAANILNAIGGTPKVGDENFVPSYPTYLPQSDEAFVVNLAPFSPETIKTFMRIELPANPSAPPRYTKYKTIGQFYAAIREGLKKTCAGNKYFVKGRNQVTPEYYYNAGGEVCPVNTLDEALAALDLIVGQGEGVAHTIYDSDRKLFGQPADYAHYFRFNEIHEARFYAQGDTPKSGPSGNPMAVDWTAVYPARSNPKSADYPAGSQLREMCDDFNSTYMDLLGAINDGFNGKQNKLLEAVQIMYQLKYKAVALMKIPYGASGETAGPTFEWVKPVNSMSWA